jgi:hypothetical protein
MELARLDGEERAAARRYFLEQLDEEVAAGIGNRALAAAVLESMGLTGPVSV